MRVKGRIGDVGMLKVVSGELFTSQDSICHFCSFSMGREANILTKPSQRWQSDVSI